MPICWTTMKLNKQCALLRNIYYDKCFILERSQTECLVIFIWLLSKSRVFNILDDTDPKMWSSWCKFKRLLYICIKTRLYCEKIIINMHNFLFYLNLIFLNIFTLFYIFTYYFATFVCNFFTFNFVTLFYLSQSMFISFVVSLNTGVNYPVSHAS